MTSRRVLIYGAAGHTGELIARRARNLGLDIIVAGRPSGRLEHLGRSLLCEWRTATIDDTVGLVAMLRDVAIVVNAAGPFEATASPLALACVTARCHYLDISGEVSAYKHIKEFDSDARNACVVVMPGVAFCVIASTFLMRSLTSRDRNPAIGRPTIVRIAFVGGPASSVGSMKSLYTSLGEGVMIVQDRKISYTPIGSLERTFDFDQCGGRLPCSAISVADTMAALSDAPASVRQIESYVEGSLLVRTFYASSGRATAVTKVQPWKSLVDKSMRLWPATPDSGVDTRAAVTVEVEDPWRRTYTATHKTPSTYDFTAAAACEVARLLPVGSGAPNGFHTPASLFYGNPDLMRVLGFDPVPDPVAAAEPPDPFQAASRRQ